MPFVPNFKPSQNAPLFHNGPWPPGTVFTVSINGLPSVSVDATQMQFCGGMAFLTRDIFEFGTPQLRGRDASQIPHALAEHLLGRLVQSFDGPLTVNQWLAVTSALDHDTVLGGEGLFHWTVTECPGIMADIDAGRLCPIGVVLKQSSLPWDVFSNHVVLVWGYERNGSMLTLHTYDCNREGQNDIFIQLDISGPTPATPIATNGTDGPTAGHVRGFFRLPYSHLDPSPAYIDDAHVTASVLPPAQMAPGSTADVMIMATNIGSTTWKAAAGYRLGSQAPQDNTTWGKSREELPAGDVDPQGTAAFRFTAVAPDAAGKFSFAWEMVHEAVRWFGPPTPTIPVAVGATGGVCEQLHLQHDQLAGELADVQDEIANLDMTNPADRRRASRLAAQARTLQGNITRLESQQIAQGCAPG